MLKLEGLIVDDSPGWLADDYQQNTTRRRAEQGTRLLLSWNEPELAIPVPEVSSATAQAKENGTMKLDKQEVELRKLEVVKAFKDDDGKDLLHVRVHLTAQEMASGDVPFVASAVAELVKGAADVEEGPNTVNVSIKRDFGVARYTLTEEGNARFKATFSGEPVNQARAQIVEGVVAFRWCVEDTAMNPTNMKKLASRVQRQHLLLSATPAQSSFPFVESDDGEAAALH